MISPRLARRIALAHKWLGLIAGVQLAVWTATGLFFTLFPIAEVRGDRLFVAAEQDILPIETVRLTPAEALAAVVEDRPRSVTLRTLGGQAVYDIRAEIGAFLVSASTGEVLSPISEDQARAIADAAWTGADAPVSMRLLDDPPRESGASGPVWAAQFAGPGRATLYVNAVSGVVGPARTDLWRAYDFFWSLHIMDYRDRESYNHPLILAAAVFALSTVLFGLALLAHRFTRVRPGRQKETG